MSVQCLCHSTPHFSQILFTVLGEQGSERGFFEEGTALVIGRRERVNFPLMKLSETRFAILHHAHTVNNIREQTLLELTE